MDDELCAWTLYLVGEVKMCIAEYASYSIDRLLDHYMTVFLVTTVAKMEENVFGDGRDAIMTRRFSYEF